MSDNYGAEIRSAVKDIVQEINREVMSRGVRVVNAMRNAELEVLSGQRSGRTYRKPGSSSTYTASAPGEPPARRTGALRLQWTGNVETKSVGSKGISIVPFLESGTPYAGYLEHGTSRMAARPFVDRISEKALPETLRIMSQGFK